MKLQKITRKYYRNNDKEFKIYFNSIIDAVNELSETGILTESILDSRLETVEENISNLTDRINQIPSTPETPLIPSAPDTPNLIPEIKTKTKSYGLYKLLPFEQEKEVTFQKLPFPVFHNVTIPVSNRL